MQKSGGVSVYWYEIISRFMMDSDVELIFVDSGKPKENILYKKLDLSGIKIIKYNKIYNRYRAVNYSENKKHIFISTYYRYSKNKSAVNITLIHDFTYEYFSKGLKLFIHHRQKNTAIKKSEKLICISHNTKSDLLKFCSKEAKDKEIVVIYNGVSDVYKTLNQDELKEVEDKNEFLKNIKSPFVLFVGARSGYKNWISAVELFKKMPREYFMISVGGPPLDETEKKLLATDIRRHTYIPPVSNEILVYLYNKTECLLYLSDYEGFGIPVVEAQKCGCPVIAKPVSSIPEVSGGGVLFFEEDTNIDEVKNFISRKHNNTLRTMSKNGYSQEDFSDDDQRRQIPSVKMPPKGDIDLNLETAPRLHALDFSWDKCYNELKIFLAKL